MRSTTLLVMAAGIGSRYGGIKQLDSFGPSGETIIDYSIYDAVRAGFNKIVIIIRKDIENDFMQKIGNKLKELVKVPIHFCYQQMPENEFIPKERTKPLGTGQAVLSARDYINEPFMVINADDFYGKESYSLMHDFLEKAEDDSHFAMAGYFLKNTLSENGSVARGICTVNNDGYLVSIEEHLEVEKTGNIAVGFSEGQKHELSLDAITSMNMMGFTPKIFKGLESGYKVFLPNMKNPLKDEFFLPKVVGDMIHNAEATVKVITTPEKWFGVTYKEDKEEVKKTIKNLIKKGVYKENLWQNF